MIRMMVGSMSKYSANPAQTPAIFASLDLVSLFGSTLFVFSVFEIIILIFQFSFQKLFSFFE